MSGKSNKNMSGKSGKSNTSRKKIGQGGQRRKQQSNGEHNARPLKVAKFASTDDDNYCTNMCILVGPKKKPAYNQILLTVLGLGPQFRQCDMVDYALPMEKDDIQELHDAMVNDNWSLPPFNIRQGDKQKTYRLRTEEAYKSWLKKRESTKQLNAHYTDVHDAATVEWGVIQGLLSSALQFFRGVWILNPTHSKSQAFTIAKQLIKRHVKTKSQRNSFFKRHIAEKRQQLAHNALNEMKGELVNNQFPDPVQACKDIRVILDHLGESSKGSDRKCFEKLQAWCCKIPMASVALIEKFDWLDPEGDLMLQELPEEADIRQEKEKAEADRIEKERTNVAAAALLEVANGCINETTGATSNSGSIAGTAKPSNDADSAEATSDQTNQNGSSDGIPGTAKPGNDKDNNKGCGDC